MIGDAVRILVIESEDESGQIVVLIKRLYQLFAYERELKINVVSMRSLEIMQQCGQRQTRGIIVLLVAVDGKVHHRQEGISIYSLLFANLSHSLVAKAQIDTETTQALKDVVIIANNADHLVISFIHLLILHRCCILLRPKSCTF